MASAPYGQGLRNLINDQQGASLQVLLIKDGAGYTFNKNHSDLSASGIAAAECDATNYARVSTTATATWDSSNSRVEVAFSDPTFPQLGGASNNDVSAAVVFITGADDASRVPVGYFDFVAASTNGNNFKVDMDAADGQMRFAV